jgi:L-lactate dehydrogenase complex protein LldE
MLKLHLPLLFDNDPNLRSRADSLAERTFELVSFLSEVMQVEQLPSRHAGGPVTYHDSCSGLRELGIKEQPRRLLRAIGATVSEMPDAEVCCGFGGTFCVKYSEISVRMASDKVRNIVATGAETVAAGDLGCLLNIAGRLHREGHHVQTRHVAEILAGMTKDVRAIGEPSD